MANDTVQQIKERLSITDVIAPYVKLTKAGRSLRGLCPFHKEKTPSFHVSPDRGTYHCFGCGVGGDMFSFLEKAEGTDFKGALKLLAEKAGVELHYDPRGTEHRSRQERLRQAISRASQFYAQRLTAETEAYAYAKKRGLTEETIRSWELGLAPDGWRTLLETLAAEGFTMEELMSAGLIKEADGKPGTYYDRFRNRLIFPIRDSSGRVVAFTGRALDPTPPAGGQAKYLNSPETELYHKSQILFGLDRAKDAIRTRGFTMLVEGQMDVLLTHQTGFANAVALSGTALSEQHLSLMKRYSENLMLVLDADPAGLTATARSAVLALSLGLRVKAGRLPKGKDPADLISEDPKEFTARIAAAKPIVEFFLTELGERERDPHRLLSIAEKVVLPLIAALKSPMERDHFLQMAARSLGLSSESVRESLAKLPKATGQSLQKPREAAPVRRPGSAVRAEQLLAIVRAYPDTDLARRVKAEYTRITGAEELPKEVLPEPVVFHVEETFGEEPSTEAADELLRAFEEAVIREAYHEAVAELRRAEAAGDAAAVAEAGTVCAELSARLGKLKS